MKVSVSSKISLIFVYEFEDALLALAMKTLH
nr:MAG TPA: hypothetical protein [Caudoviricetes sp.]